MMRFLWLFLLLMTAPAVAQNFPPLTGRVVDQADLLTPVQEIELSERLAEVERASSRQFVIAIIASLEDYPIEDYGYRLGRHWGIGQEGANNGLILVVAPNERKVRIEVGYGLEGIMTDALSSQIINNEILPRFREGDFPGGIIAGANAVIEQLQAPPEVAEQRALEAAQAGQGMDLGDMDTLGRWVPLVVMVLFFFFIMSAARSGLRGRRYRGRRRGVGPIVIWGPGTGGWGGGSSWGGGSWGGGGGGGFGGFSGGGGSFGGGGASGGW